MCTVPCPRREKPFVPLLFVVYLVVCRGCSSTSIAVDVPLLAASASRFAMDALSRQLQPPLKALVAPQLPRRLTGPLVKSSARLASLLSLLLPLTVLFLPSPKHLCYRVAVAHLWCRGENVAKQMHHVPPVSSSHHHYSCARNLDDNWLGPRVNPTILIFNDSQHLIDHLPCLESRMNFNAQ